MVILLEMPEAFDLINSFKSAAECEAKKESKGTDDGQYEEFRNDEDAENFESFAANQESNQAEEDCLGLIDKYSVG